MTLQVVKKLFHRVPRSLRAFKPLAWTGGSPITGSRPAVKPMPPPPGSVLGDWLAQTVAYHH